MQHGLLAIDNQRVTGVMTTLKTHGNRCLIGKQIDDFPFPLVAPLRS